MSTDYLRLSGRFVRGADEVEEPRRSSSVNSDAARAQLREPWPLSIGAAIGGDMTTAGIEVVPKPGHRIIDDFWVPGREDLTFVAATVPLSDDGVTVAAVLDEVLIS